MVVKHKIDRKTPIRRGFQPSFVNYKKWCTRLTAASDKVYQLLAQGRWFSPGTPASSTTKTGHHEMAEILLKVTLNTKNQSHQTNHRSEEGHGLFLRGCRSFVETYQNVISIRHSNIEMHSPCFLSYLLDEIKRRRGSWSYGSWI